MVLLKVTEAPGDTADTYTVVLDTGPTGNVQIDISFDTAQVTVNGKSVSPQALTFTTTEWNLPQTVTVDAYDDTLVEGPHNSVITHAALSTDSVYDGIPIADLNVTIIDNEAADTTPPTFGGLTTATMLTAGVPEIELTWTAADDGSGTAQGDLLYDICMSTTAGACTAGFSVAYTSAAGATGAFKALIVDSVPNRRACLNADCIGEGGANFIDWVLLPGVTYFGPDGTTPIGPANADGIFTFPLNATVGPGGGVWTGLNMATPWTTPGNPATDTCNNWTDSTTGTWGWNGESNPTPPLDYRIIGASNTSAGGCSDLFHLYCVQQ